MAQQPVQYLLILRFAAKSDYFAHPAAFLVLPLIQPYPKGRSKYTVRYALETHIFRKLLSRGNFIILLKMPTADMVAVFLIQLERDVRIFKFYIDN